MPPDPHPPFSRKRNRLDLSTYNLANRYFLTLCTADKSPHFTDAREVSAALIALSASAVGHRFTILAYCFMPDHLHLLALTQAPADLVAFIRHFKQTTGYAFRKRHGQPLWQKSFYDHVLRGDESVQEVMRYMFANPVRRGLATDPLDYPHQGTLLEGITLAELFS